MTCPRCGEVEAEARFYGPCQTCRRALRARFSGDPAGAVVSGRPGFEPRPNVTPNFVATKD